MEETTLNLKLKISGMEADLLAFKPSNDFDGNIEIRLVKFTLGNNGYATYTYRKDNDNYFWGHYFGSSLNKEILADAIKDFNERG